MPPCCAMAIAIAASVTVSMADGDQRDVQRDACGSAAVRVLVSTAAPANRRARRSTSSKASASSTRDGQAARSRSVGGSRVSRMCREPWRDLSAAVGLARARPRALAAPHRPPQAAPASADAALQRALPMRPRESRWRPRRVRCYSLRLAGGLAWRTLAKWRFIARPASAAPSRPGTPWRRSAPPGRQHLRARNRAPVRPAP